MVLLSLITPKVNLYTLAYQNMIKEITWTLCIFYRFPYVSKLKTFTQVPISLNVVFFHTSAHNPVYEHSSHNLVYVSICGCVLLNREKAFHVA